MSIMEWRGGIPAVYRVAGLGTVAVQVFPGQHLERLDPGAQDGRMSRGTSKWMVAQNHDATNILKIYFFADHVTNDEHYVTVPVATAAGGPGKWEGPVECREFWIAAGAATLSVVDVTTFNRRG